MSSSYDSTVRLWNLDSEEEVKVLKGHQDQVGDLLSRYCDVKVCCPSRRELFPRFLPVQVFCMAWSPDGKLLATVCKDGKVRIYDPRKSATPVQVQDIRSQTLKIAMLCNQ